MAHSYSYNSQLWSVDEKVVYFLSNYTSAVTYYIYAEPAQSLLIKRSKYLYFNFSILQAMKQ